MAENPVTTFADRYGPYGFGVVSLLLIWFTIVRPEMERSRASFDQAAKVTQDLLQVSDKLKDALESMERTQRGAALSKPNSSGLSSSSSVR